jgi:hypothetical protein
MSIYRVHHIDLLNVLTYLSAFDNNVLEKIHCDGEQGRVVIFVDPKEIPKKDLDLILDCNCEVDEEGFFILKPTIIIAK